MRFIRLIFATPFFFVGALLFMIAVVIGGIENGRQITDSLERLTHHD